MISYCIAADANREYMRGAPERYRGTRRPYNLRRYQCAHTRSLATQTESARIKAYLTDAFARRVVSCSIPIIGCRGPIKIHTIEIDSNGISPKKMNAGMNET